VNVIPRVFWRVWLDEAVPERLNGFWRGFQRHHPTWAFRTVDDSRDMPWMRPAIRRVFDQCTTHAGRSDVVRYEALYQFGGVYVDADVECLRPFDELVAEASPFAGWEDERLVCPTVIGCPPKHPALGDLLDILPEWVERRPNQPPNHQTGPYLFTACWRWRDDVRLLPSQTFYPVHWSSKKELGGPYPTSSFAVHHWDAGWLPDGPPQRD
jgi:mannosyltransferase OCH1-like enzyme